MLVHYSVAPLVGAWIEINEIMKIISEEKVAPLVGAWIEIIKDIYHLSEHEGRSPCGSVD